MKAISILLAGGLVVLGAAALVRAHEGHAPSSPKTSSRTATRAPAAKSAPARAAVPAATVTQVRLTGELIDPQCWYTHNGEGKDHAACAVNCAKGGQDLAFLDAASGEVHTILASGHGADPNHGLYEKVGVPVRIRGTVYRRGANRALMLESVERVR